MWDKIKKAINSNIAKPLNILLGELYNSHRTDIVNTYNKANEANVNAWQSLQKGQEIVNIMNDTGGKRYTVIRNFSVWADGRSKFEYYGSGVLKKLAFERSEAIQYFYIYLDDVQFNYNTSDRGYMDIEFRNSFKVIARQGYSTSGVNLNGFIQTEK